MAPGMLVAVFRMLRRSAPAWAGLCLYAGCISENAVAVDGQDPCANGACNAGGSAGSGADASSNTDAASSDLPPYTLIVDAPDNRSNVSGVVTVTGRTSGFINVEVWDAAHKHPPLSQTFPNSDGSFQTAVDTAGLAAGPTTWTVFAWDSPPGEPYAHSATVTLQLVIDNPP
jgi:hypothetical protein